ncbi:MAG: class I SAM-dependent methyltransferase [Kiritimatiellia bacterium]
MNTFFELVIAELLSQGVLRRDSRILVMCGGETDHAVLMKLGFTNVVISNVDERRDRNDTAQYAPFEWSYQNAESMTFEDRSFEFVIEHSGLHHLPCPQRGIAEMYRVASKGIIGFEANRNLFTTLGVKLGFGQEYETAAVFYNDLKYGGISNSAIPNYVYRFTAGDIRRTVSTLNPAARHRYRFWHATQIPAAAQNIKNPLVRFGLRTFGSLLKLAGRSCPFLANNMAFFAAKPAIPDDLHPWLKLENGNIVPNREFLERKYRPGRVNGPAPL